MQKENEAIVLPALQRTRDEIHSLIDEEKKLNALIEGENKKRDDYIKKVEQLTKDKQNLTKTLEEERQNLEKLKGEPARLRKQGDIVKNAVNSMSKDLQAFNTQVSEINTQLKKQDKVKTLLKSQYEEECKKNDAIRAEIARKDAEINLLQKSIQEQEIQDQNHREKRVELDMTTQNLKNEGRQLTEAINYENKQYKQLKRDLKREIEIGDGIKAQYPIMDGQVIDAKHQLSYNQSEVERAKHSLENVEVETEILIAQFLGQEKLEEKQKVALNILRKQKDEQELQLDQWSEEVRKMNKMIAILNTQRELQARASSQALQNEKNAQNDLQMKQLTIMDLTKRANDMNVKLKEFSALYDVVKNERNKYVNLIQGSNQQLAEMNEKIRILTNEVEILKGESLAKDRALTNERLDHEKAKYERDALRSESNKNQALYREKQEEIEQQIMRIDKLNSVINTIEREMLKLKREYERAVEARNFMGVQLIDRNDELCILYEKSNIQEETLKKGEISLKEREEEVRMLEVTISEVDRQIDVVRKQIPKVPVLLEEVNQLRLELQQEREMTEKLCKDLETPENLQRWNPLPGDDLDMEQMTAKLEVIQDRFEKKKEQLLEKELVLEEVTVLSEKLRQQAKEGRDGTLSIAKQVNELQSKLKDLTRSMMATVSELSMYQATALKLEQEKAEREKLLEDATYKLEHGEAPTEEAVHDWYRLERDRLLAIERKQEKQRNQIASTLANQFGSPTVKTTAEPRPNAYLPSDVPLPKPYGSRAPFKPTVPGSTMRHIRKPKETEIEI